MIGTAAVLLGMAAWSRAAESPFHDKPASPRSLPADNLPPFRMLDDNGNLIPIPELPPGGLHRGAGAPPESLARGPSMELAIEAARAAVAACRAEGYRVGVSVIDSVGEARAMLTADGSDGSHIFVATRKALTALAFAMPSSQAAEAVAADKALLGRVTPNMFVMGGALPIVVDHATVGAIGVSGAAGVPFGHQDEVCALAGLRKIQHQLNLTLATAAAMTMLNMTVTLERAAAGQPGKVGDVDKIRLVYDANAVDPTTKRVQLANMQHYMGGKWFPPAADPVMMPTSDSWLDTSALPYRLHFKAYVVHGQPIIIDVDEDSRTLSIHPQSDPTAILESGHYEIDPTPTTGAEAMAAGSAAAAPML
jgi:uncharacterized protein GlcG (DUF336 family)